MGDEPILKTRPDYVIALLRLLSELPGGQGQASEVCRLFEEKYGRRIPEKDRGLRSTGAIIWENNVHWSRHHLKGYGFLDPSQYGIWRITEEGRQWLKENPGATRIGRTRRRTTSSTHRTTIQKGSSVAGTGITLEMLEQTRKEMSANQFRQVWGSLYDQLVAEERAKTMTTITQMELGRRTRLWLDEVHTFLQGKNASTPTADMLCDWVQFCYTLGLYREAAGLFTHILEDEVESGTFRRAKRIAEVSRSKPVG